MLLSHVRINPALAGERVERLPFLSHGPVEFTLRKPLTLLVGENGSGKTTLLEAIAACCGIRPEGGGSYAETEDDRMGTAISAAVEVNFARSGTRGLFLRADRFAATMAAAGQLPMPATREWRRADEQSRGEGVLSLLTAKVDASEGMLFILDEPETGLSPQRQMALLYLLDELSRDGRSQALVATHSPILLAHPACDLLWVDDDGITRRALPEIPHWRDMRQFMTNPENALARLLQTSDDIISQSDDEQSEDGRSVATSPVRSAGKAAGRKRTTRLWILSDLHLEAVPHPEAFRPNRPAFDVLIVAGDVWEGEIQRALEAVAALANGKPAVFVMGNHEPWNAELQQARSVARLAAKRLDITLLDDSEAEVEGISFVGGTLWADRDLVGQGGATTQETGEQIQIVEKDSAHLITSGDAAALHARTRAMIEAVVARPRAGPLVVVTHHAPHPCCLPAGQRTEPPACHAVSDLSHLTDAGIVSLWVHGHLHHSVDHIRPGGTRLVCNPAGLWFSNATFQDDFVVEI